MSRTGSTPDPLAVWPIFTRQVRKRLERGRAEYHDGGFNRPPEELLGELQQEALDLAGWGFVLWSRLEAMRASLSSVDSETHGGGL